MSSETGRIWTEGIVAGLLGFGSVVLFFLALNLVRGEPPLETVARLGAPLVPGEGEGGGRVAAAFAYNGVHLVVSLGVGLFAAWLVHEAEAHRSLWYVFFFVFMAATFYGIVVMGVWGSEILAALGWREIVAANALWAGSILVYILRSHPGLRARLEEADPEA